MLAMPIDTATGMPSANSTSMVVSMIFAAVSGSSVATTFAIGAILIPAMVRHGYPVSFAAALQATSAELGVIIPPSIPKILYGIPADVSVTELFIAGIGPGLLIGGALILTVWLWAKIKAYGARSRRLHAASRGDAAPGLRC